MSRIYLVGCHSGRLVSWEGHSLDPLPYLLGNNGSTGRCIFVGCFYSMVVLVCRHDSCTKAYEGGNARKSRLRHEEDLASHGAICVGEAACKWCLKLQRQLILEDVALVLKNYVTHERLSQFREDLQLQNLPHDPEWPLKLGARWREELRPTVIAEALKNDPHFFTPF